MGLNSLEMEAYIDSFAKTSASIGELIEKIFCHHPALKMALRTRLAGYEGVPVDRQSIYHNIDTLKISLKGALSMAHAQVDDKPYYLTLKTIEGGNAKLPLKMAERLGERVQLHKALRRVHDNNGQIKLEFKDGTIAFYDKLILAVPPSVYGDIKFDDSILPQESVEVFSKVGYGKNYKVLVPMPICSDGTYRCIITKHQVSFFNADGRILVMYCHQPLPSVSKEMETILKGQGVSEPILSEPQTIKDQHFEVYEKPSIYLWENDPYAKGAYSGYSTELSEELDKLIDYRGIPVKEVFKPLNDCVYFIGEHTTISDVIGTMEAAVESGERISKLFP
jgi:monoamine oxidase